MDLDSLQKWVEALYYSVKVKRDIAEYQALLLDEIARPWPFYQTPKSVQETYRAKVRKQKADNDELLKLSEFDKELQTVNDILEKARILHEKDESPKTAQSLENSKPTGIRKTPDAGNMGAKKVTKRTECSVIGDRSMRNSTNGKPGGSDKLKVRMRPTNSRQVASKQNPSHGRTVRVSSAGSRGNPIKSAKSKERSPLTHTTSSKDNIKETRRTEPKNKITKSDQTSKSLDSVSADSGKSKEAPDGVDVDHEVGLNTMKLEFNDIKAELELPPKTKKLLAMHAKLKDQVGDVSTVTESEEEASFIRKMHQTDQLDRPHESVRTLASVNYESTHCMRTCANATKVAKGLSHVPKSSNKQYVVQAVALASRSLDIVERLYDHLLARYETLSKAKLLHSGSGSFSSDLGPESLSQLPLHDLTGILDDLPHPSLSLSYQTMKEAANWACKKLEHQFLIIEKDLLDQISKCYFSLFDGMLKFEKHDTPSPELVNVLQNAYGLLADDSILLPAYVVAE